MTTKTRPGDLVKLRHLDAKMVGAVYDRYFPDIFIFVNSRLKDARVAEEITNEVFIRLLKMVNLGLTPRTRLKTWLLGAASHLIVTHLNNSKNNLSEP